MTGKITAVDRTEECLARIARFNPTYKAFALVTDGLARDAAAAADKATSEGRWLGLLHGMTIGIKDNIDVAGHRAAAGSTFFKGHVPNDDAPVAARLRRHGAVVVGKASMHELAFGARSADQVGGQVRNPWDVERIPGGSSGGSGAATALDLCQVAIGTDTGGSIRVPASFCGVAGLRPTWGRVPNRGCFPVSASFDTIGPLGREVGDLARVYTAIAGYDPLDPTSADRPVDDVFSTLHAGVRGVRIGLPKNFYYDDVDPEIATAVRALADRLAREGAIVSEITLAEAADMNQYAANMILGDACELHAERLDKQPEVFGQQTRERMLLGRKLTAADYAAANRARERWRQTLAAVFRQVDIVLTPTSPVVPPPVDDGRQLVNTTREVTRFTYGGGFASLPGLSLPCGFTRAGLPIGAQLEAAWWNEGLLLRVGQAWQSITDWHRRKPPVS